jgi:hypothetical protein
MQLLALPALGLASPSAHALGFTGTFDPDQWVVVNTYEGSPQPSLTGSATNCSNYPPAPTPEDPNPSGCVNGYTDTSLTLFSTSNANKLPNGVVPNAGTEASTELKLKNTSNSPLRISFDWSFSTADIPSGDYSLTLALDSGFANFNIGQGAYGLTYNVSQQLVSGPVAAYAYVPAGATLSFTIATTNDTQLPFAFALDNFQAVPAPLPISGAGSAFLVARRLRRRVQQADRLKAASPSSSARLPNFSAQRAQMHHQQALSHYGRLLSGPIATPHCAKQGAATAWS